MRSFSRLPKSMPALALGALFLGLSVHCGGGGGGNPPPVNTPVNTISVTGVSVEASLSLIATRTGQLHATITPANATNRNVTWTSDTSAVATVSSSGLVSGLSAGTANITVKTADGGHAATCAVTVSPSIPVTGVALKASTSLGLGATERLLPVFSPANVTNTHVTWTSSDPTKATVDNEGLVTAVAAGTAIITVTTVDGGYTASCIVSLGSGLTVGITGLPASLDADVTVAGPDSYNQHLTATQTFLGLADGIYTITAATVTDPASDGLGRGNHGTLGPDHLQRYPLWPVQTVTLTGGAASGTAVVEYPAATLTVQIPTKEDANVKVPMDFVLVPAGSFTMGSDVYQAGFTWNAQPTHFVTIGEAFYVAKTELTQAQWKAVMGANFNPSQSHTWDTNPVDNVSWDDIRVPSRGFLDQLNAALPGFGFRLPSEAEWEYACRAGTTTTYFFGVDSTNFTTYAVDGTSNTYNAASKAPNAWGLYDMAGNVWEWTEDDAHDNYTGAPTDGTAWVDATRSTDRVLCGGGWNTPVGDLCSASRTAFESYRTINQFGFRLVLPVPVTH